MGSFGHLQGSKNGIRTGRSDERDRASLPSPWLRHLERAMTVGLLLLLTTTACSQDAVDTGTTGPDQNRLVAEVRIEPANVLLAPDEDARLEAIVLSARGRRINGRTVRWTSETPSVVQVGEDGRVVAGEEGAGVVTATVEGVQARATVDVRGEVVGIRLRPERSEVAEGASVQVAAEFEYENGAIRPARQLRWSTDDPDVATIDADGLLTGVSTGDVGVLAAARGKNGNAQLKVTRGTVGSVTIGYSTLLLAPGGETQLWAEVKDKHGNQLSAEDVQWSSSDPGVATVSSEGLVRAVAQGETVIEASLEKASSSVLFTVSTSEDAGDAMPDPPGPVSDLRVAGVGPNAVTLEFTEVDDGTGSPADYTVRYAQGSLAWSSARDVTKGSCSSPVQGTEVGRRLTCTVEGLQTSTSYEFQVAARREGSDGATVYGELSPVVSATTEDPELVVRVIPSSVTLDVGESRQLEAEVTDVYGNPVDGTVTWVSTNTSVATVSSSGSLTGSVTGKSKGSARVEAETEEAEGASEVDVTEPLDANEPPRASFTFDCTDLRCSFDASGSSDDEGIVAYRWEFGDGDGASGRTVEHAYGSGGEYRVRLEVEDGAAAVDDTVRTVALAGSSSPPSSGILPAFPGAEGYGAAALAECRSKPLEVLFVTNRNDSGSGSLRDAIQRSRSDRFSVIVFRTGGTVTVGPPIVIDRACLYVAGQTAPGGGIQIRKPENQGHLVVLFERDGSAHDVVLRYLRVRSGRGEAGGGDNIGITGGHNLVLDHMSLQWANDETIGINTMTSGGTEIRDVSLQRSIIAETLSPHTTALLIGGRPDDGSPPISRIAMHSNLFAHNGHRNPRVIHRKEIKVVNNVVYNARARAGRTGQDAEVDFIGNYYRAGPWTNTNRVLQHEMINEPYLLPSVHLAGNVADYKSGASQRDLIQLTTGGDLPESSFRSGPLPDGAVPITVRSASQALESVLSDVGANARLDCRGDWVATIDAVDRDLIEDVQGGTGPGSDAENDHQDDYGGYPALSPGTACPDADGDGMPDAFESRWAFDPGDPGDNRLDADGDGYTNLEEYLNGSPPR